MREWNGTRKERTMASCEELMQSIRPGMRLDKDFFLKIYGYEIGTPGFADTALEKLEGIYIMRAKPGQENPRNTYAAIVAEYEHTHGMEMQEVARWYLKQLHDRQERAVRKNIAGDRRSGYKFAGFPEDW